MSDLKIEIDVDGLYEKGLFFDKKSYVLVNEDLSLIIKGNTLSGRSNEQFILDYVGQALNCLLDNQPERIRHYYDEYAFDIETQTLDVEDVKKRSTMSMSLEAYRNKIAAGQSRLGAYEVACYMSSSEVDARIRKDYIKGDVIETWVEQPELVEKTYKTKPSKWITPKKSAYEVMRPVRFFNGNIYKDHYRKRLDDTTKKFMIVLGYEKFIELFPEIKISKSDKAKFITTLGLEKFNELFLDFGWTKPYYNLLEQQDKILFQKMVWEEKLNSDFKSIFTKTEE